MFSREPRLYRLFWIVMRLLRAALAGCIAVGRRVHEKMIVARRFFSVWDIVADFLLSVVVVIREYSAAEEWWAVVVVARVKGGGSQGWVLVHVAVCNGDIDGVWCGF